MATRKTSTTAKKTTARKTNAKKATTTKTPAKKSAAKKTDKKMSQIDAALAVLKKAGVDIVTCQRGRLRFDDLGGIITAIIDQHGSREESAKLASHLHISQPVSLCRFFCIHGSFPPRAVERRGNENGNCHCSNHGFNTSCRFTVPASNHLVACLQVVVSNRLFRH